MVESTGYSSGEPAFDAQHPHEGGVGGWMPPIYLYMVSAIGSVSFRDICMIFSQPDASVLL